MTHQLKPLGWVSLAVIIAGLSGIGWHWYSQAHSTTTTQRPARAAVKQTQPTKAQIKTQLQKRWTKILAKVKTPVSIAVYTKQYDVTVTVNNQPDATHTTASIAKVGFLAQLLHQAQQAGTKLTTTQAQNATAAIENSDNAAATALYDDIGAAAGVSTLFSNLGMTNSAAGTTGWAATTTTASDQLKLLKQVFYSGTYLSSASKAYIKALMNQVESDQQWGVSAGSSQFQLKNGWRLNADNTWIVNSIGHLGSGDQSCTIAVLTDDNQSLAKGEALVEKLAKATGEVLNLAQ